MYINLHSHEQSKISFSSQSHWHILFLIFLIIAMLIGVRWHLLLLKVSGVNHFSKHLLSTFMFVFFWPMPGLLFIFKCVFGGFSECFAVPNQVCVPDPCQMYELPVFSPFSRLSLHSAFLYCA